ncbi:MAG: hypothetical protein KGI97_03785 [Alphaproteobacteria bacterium]|nr:hypothetical protein [Alphaproteobacteria bacterium]
MQQGNLLHQSGLLAANWRVASWGVCDIPNPETELAEARKKGTVKGETGGAGAGILSDKAKSIIAFLREAAGDMFMWREHFIIGSPHQELVPWCGWLRPVQNRHLDWLIAWPEEAHLHP